MAGAPDLFCRWCGHAAGECDQITCRRELDSERFCTTCGRRLRVLITPAGHSSSCRTHGPLPAPSR